MDIFGQKKGQGATEYLVLLAVVLIVAMVAIALLGFFPGLAGDAKKTQSDAYWRGEARPFAVLEHSQTLDHLTVVLQNVEAEQRSLAFINITGQGATFGSTFNNGSENISILNNTNQYFPAGEKRTFVITGNANCTSGSTYEYQVTLIYNNSDNTIVNQRQFGAKTLVGKCS